MIRQAWDWLGYAVDPVRPNETPAVLRLLMVFVILDFGAIPMLLFLALINQFVINVPGIETGP